MWRRIRGWWLVVGGAVVLALTSINVKALPATVASLALAVAGAVAAVLSSRGVAVLADQAGISDDSSSEKLLLAGRGRLPRVRDILDPISVGVHPAPAASSHPESSSRVPPFVYRDRSAEIELAVRSGGFVLVVGDSTAGKSRAAFEAARACLASYILIRPAGREAVSAALAAAQRFPRCVLWLDDLEQYLGNPGLTRHLLAGVLGNVRRQVVVLATMRANERARYSPRRQAAENSGASELLRAGWAVIEAATEIRLERRWTDAELDRARVFRSDQRIAAALEHADQFGVAEYLAAGPQLLAEWQDSWSPATHPRGAAIVAAAVDARRVGFHRPLPRDALRELHEHYLRRRGGAALRPESWDDALAWAVEPLHATTSLLIPHDGDRYLAFDYLADACEKDPTVAPVPDPTWEKVIATADPAEANDVGLSAYVRHQLRHSMSAFRKALEGGQIMAAIALADCFARGQADNHTAVEVLRKAIALAEAREDTDATDLLALHRHYAFWCSREGDNAEALRVAKENVSRTQQLLGMDHPETLESRIVLARCTGDAGDPAAALRLAHQLASDCRQVLGERDWRTSSSRFEIAVWTAKCGDLDTAIQLHEELITEGRTVLGVIESRITAAKLIGRNGDSTRAARLLEAIVEDVTKLLGADHAFTVRSIDELRRWREAPADDGVA